MIISEALILICVNRVLKVKTRTICYGCIKQSYSSYGNAGWASMATEGCDYPPLGEGRPSHDTVLLKVDNQKAGSLPIFPVHRFGLDGMMIDRRSPAMNDLPPLKFTCKTSVGHDFTVIHVWNILADMALL